MRTTKIRVNLLVLVGLGVALAMMLIWKGDIAAQDAKEILLLIAGMLVGSASNLSENQDPNGTNETTNYEDDRP